MSKYPTAQEYREKHGKEAPFGTKLSNPNQLRNRMLVAGAAAAVAITAVATYMSFSSDKEVSKSEAKTAADFAVPPENYSPDVCPDSVDELKKLQIEMAARLVAVYETSEQIKEDKWLYNGQPFSNISDVNEENKYGQMVYELDVSNGSYRAEVYLASDGNESGIPSSAYFVGLSSRMEGDQPSPGIEVMLGDPSTYEDYGGPNFPPQTLIASVNKGGGSDTSYISWSSMGEPNVPPPNPAKCSEILNQATYISEELVHAIELQSPVALPK